jgi:hypothetical protein
MKSRFILVLSILVMSIAAQAQYSSAVGLRLGYPGAVSYKKFLNDANAVELMAGLYYGDLSVGALYEIHKDLNVDNLRWYYGAGAQVSFYKGIKSGVAVGLSGTLGLDYSFDDLPLNLSIDIVPTFYLLGSDYSTGYLNGFDGLGALSARYILDNSKR